jgi:outer membrane immunogenic protein
MKKVLFAGLALVSFGAVAPGYAADMPVKAPMMAAPVAGYNWTGLYIGAHVGGGWGHNQSTVTDNSSGNFPIGTTTAPFDKAGILGGAQAGFNWQFAPQWVLGIEGEYSKANIDGSTSEPSILVPGRTVSNFHTIDNIWTVAGRLGYAWNSLMLYAKGGAGWADFSSSARNISAGGTVTCCTVGQDTRSGWLAGVGLEYGFAPNWSAKIEYEHIDFGTTGITVTNTVTGAAGARDVRSWIDIAKFGVNYRFSWLGVGR